MNVRVFVIVPCLVLFEHEKEIVLDRHCIYCERAQHYLNLHFKRCYYVANPVQ